MTISRSAFFLRHGFLYGIQRRKLGVDVGIQNNLHVITLSKYQKNGAAAPSSTTAPILYAMKP